MAEHDPALCVREAQVHYFETRGFPQDGGYADRWLKLRLGPIPFWFPNTNARRRAVRLYDIHPLLTGYDTDWKGEAEIGALRTRLLLDRAPSDTFSAWATRNP